MKKKKKRKKRSLVNSKYFLFFCLFLLLIFSYFEVNDSIYVTGYLKDVFFFSTRLVSSDEFISSFDSELKNENDELKALLAIDDSLSEYSPVYATVVERNVSYWFNSFTINKGIIDGIEEGMAVVDSYGLVGSIDKVSINTSVVKLITSPVKYNTISVKIDSGSGINKILRVSNNELIIEGINKNLSIKEGDKIVTSGLSDKFPSGILVGKINSLESDSYNVSDIAYVDIASNINNLRFVAVLKRG